VYYKNVFLIISAMILCTGCDGFANQSALKATPDFFTATLPSSPSPEATQTSTPPAPVATNTAAESNMPPVEGTTTTQVNVRAGPSTASESFGLVGPFVQVQVVGKDASGSWYQVIYAGSETGKGWVRAEYVQANASAEIPMVETTSSSGSAVSGLATQKINIRNGPGTEYELLGVLNPNDVVFITGKDPGGTWVQIEFASATSSGGKGWVTVEFLKVGNIENVPLIGNVADETATPTDATSTPGATALSAMQDNDSMQAPLAVTFFSAAGSRVLQVNGDLSASAGDVEDWIQFTSDSTVVSIQVTCSNDTLRIELWKDEKPLDGPSLSCGTRSFVTVVPGSNYFLRLSESNVNEPAYISYVLKAESVR
jgi:uncharacterized protein YraI